MGLSTRKIPELPQESSDDWGINEIDAFILAKLKQSDVSPPELANEEILLRRLHYTLTGLPAPLNGKLNYKDKLEDLLESPHYGEKWARHWMDVARYADSNGLDENLAFAHAWRYRDYLIDAFNKDLPFNRFVVEQIAGDILFREVFGRRESIKSSNWFSCLGTKTTCRARSSKNGDGHD